MASNHISHFDPPIISGFFPRRLDWLAMEEMFRSSWGKRTFKALNCIPVDRRGNDRTALRQAIQRLSEGRSIGIFPEGGIRAGKTSILNGAEMKPGLAALSTLSGASIIPCALVGSDRLYKPTNWFRRTNIYFLIGEPLFPPQEKANLTEAREKFAADVASAFVSMRDRIVERFGLNPNDLPQTPQARKGNSD